MEHAEYKKILDEAMVDYVNNGGSVFYMGCVVKEYIFDYEDKIRKTRDFYDSRQEGESSD